MMNRNDIALMGITILLSVIVILLTYKILNNKDETSIDETSVNNYSSYETITIEKSPLQTVDHIDESDEMIVIYLKAKEDYNEGL